MPYPHSLLIDGMLAKEETTYGTDPTPTVGANGVRAVGRLWPSMGDEYAWPNTREDVARGSLIEPVPAVPRGRMINLDFQVEAKGAGSAYTVSPAVRPEVDPLLVAAGLARTHGTSAQVSYALADTGHGSATLWVYAGGKLFKIHGFRCNLVWTPSAGELGRFRFAGQGLVASSAEQAQPSITYDSAESPAAVNMGLSINPGSAWSPNFETAELDLGNEIQMLPDANAADGIEQFAIASRAPRFTVNPRVVDLSDYDPYTMRSARTQNTIDATLGSTQYNRFDIDVNDARVLTVASPEDNGFAGWSIEYLLRDLNVIFD